MDCHCRCRPRGPQKAVPQTRKTSWHSTLVLLALTGLSVNLVTKLRLSYDQILLHQQQPFAVTDAVLPTFTELLRASGSDKYDRHHYERYYEHWLLPYRQQKGVKLLEIGAERGRSLQLWSDYFTQPAAILGLAYGEASEGVEERVSNYSSPVVSVYRGDQSSNETMEYLRQQGPWDIIIDDGSHVPAHMIYSLFSLWQSVRPGGLYVIEDLETNYWPAGAKLYGYRLVSVGIGRNASFSAIAKLQELENVLMRRQIGATNLTVMPGDEDICSIEWGMNLVKLRKCTLEEAAMHPPMQEPRYRPKVMNAWLEQARQSNPVI